MVHKKVKYLKQLLQNFRASLFLISWFAAISSTVWNSDQNYFINFGVITFGLFLFLTIPYIKRQSFLIILILSFIYICLIPGIPELKTIFEAGQYILVFAGLIPTMGLVRSTAKKLRSVKESQKLLSSLPKESFGSGFQITAHFFGSVINTGVFALLAAALPPKSNYEYRKKVAEAVLRGMSSSATWSPFFVAFVVGQVYLDVASSWAGLAIGFIIASSFSLASILLLNTQLNWKKLKLSFTCLKPILPALLVTIGLVVVTAFVFRLTALSAVIVVMPLLVTLYLSIKPSAIRPILIDTTIHLKQNTDDVLIISVAMLVGYFVTQSPEALSSFDKLNFLIMPSSSILIFIPVTMTILSFLGIHPVISSTVLLSIFTSTEYELSKPLLMQAHLLGWCTGTMSSIASLSVITCSSMFDVPSSKLCFGINGLVSVFFALAGGIMLAITNELTFL